MIEFAVLGSGSSGNSAVICYGDTKILVDAGISAKQISLRLEQIGINPDSLTAIVLTHEHGDHVQGLEVFCRKRSIPVYATVHTSHMVQQDRIKKSQIPWRKFEAGSSFKVDELTIDTFNVPHDAVDPVGFVFQSPTGSVGVLSDVGHITRLIVERLKGVDSLFVESNYDDIMLQEDEKRPWSLKQRISNRHGHLSNKQTADFLKEVATPELNRVVLGHLSSDCNTPEKALAFSREALAEMGLNDVKVECAERKTPTALHSAVKGVVVHHDPVSKLDTNIEDVIAKVEADLNQPKAQPPSLVEAKAVPADVTVGTSLFSKEPAQIALSEDATSSAQKPPSPAVKKQTADSDADAVQMELAF